MKFGIEMEFVVMKCNGNSALHNFRTISEELTEAGHRYHGWSGTSSSYDTWSLHTDGSCKTDSGSRGIDYYGAELVSPALKLDEMSKSLREALKILKNTSKYNRVVLNKTCGVHVHVELGDDYRQSPLVRNLIKTVKDIEGELFNMLPKSRNVSDYCSKISSYSIEEILNGESGKYRGIRISSIPTIEFRQHAASLNPTKIMNWAMLIYMITRYSYDNEVMNEKQTLAKVLDYMEKMSAVISNDDGVTLTPEKVNEIRKYIYERSLKLNKVQAEVRFNPAHVFI